MTRWRDMQGPIGPIIRLMAGWYAARFSADFDDLVQEAWLAILRRPYAHQPKAAQQGMHNYCGKWHTLRKYDQFRAIAENDGREDVIVPRLDVETYLTKLPDDLAETVKLVWLEGHDTLSAAQRLGINRTTVNRRLKSALQAMRVIANQERLMHERCDDQPIRA